MRRLYSSPRTKFVRQCIALLETNAPISMLCSYECVKRAYHRSMEECYQSDIKVSLGLMSYVDFREGVRALTVDKDNNPRW